MVPYVSYLLDSVNASIDVILKQVLPHASLAECFQTVVAAGGTVLKLMILRWAYMDLRWLRENGFNGPREFLAMSRIRQSWMLLIIHMSLLAVGLASLRLGPPYTLTDVIGELGDFLPTPRTALPPQGEIRVWELAFVTCMLSLFSAWNLRDRERLIKTDWTKTLKRWGGTERRREVTDGQVDH